MTTKVLDVFIPYIRGPYHLCAWDNYTFSLRKLGFGGMIGWSVEGKFDQACKLQTTHVDDHTDTDIFLALTELLETQYLPQAVEILAERVYEDADWGLL